MTDNHNAETPQIQLINIAVGIAIRTSTGPEVLVARRRKAAIRGGLWEFPGGKIEDGESAEVAIHREFLEEIGCEIEILAALPASEHHDPAIPLEPHVRLRPFLVRLATASRPLPHAADELRWVLLDDLRGLAWPPANLAVIDSVERWWRTRRPGPAVV